MRRTLKYFAYGSNLHPERLRRRTGWCRLLGPASITGYRLVFHKRGMDGSGKCNALETGDPGDVLFGAVFEIHAHHKPRLDRAEGRGTGYTQARVRPSLGGARPPAFTYVARPGHIDDRARPFDWYLDLVLTGARYHAMPQRHIDMLRTVSGVADPDTARALEHRRLLDAIRPRIEPLAGR